MRNNQIIITNYRGYFMGTGKFRWLILAGFAALLLNQPESASADGARQLATGGGTNIEGSAGGGLVPWAVLTGYATEEEISTSAFYSYTTVDDYRLDAYGAAVNFNNRVEWSVARQEFDLVTLGPALGLPGASLEQDIFGFKYRISGDIIYTDWPQITAGIQYKRNRDFLIPGLVGAEDDSGYDVYLSAAKLFLAGLGGNNVFVNGTIRWTEANETGLLGFGSVGNSERSFTLEGSAGVLLSRRWAIGAEYRMKPDNLDAFSEDDWYDVFVGYFPNRHISIIAAYVRLGEIATLPDQSGWYLSLEASF